MVRRKMKSSLNKNDKSTKERKESRGGKTIWGYLNF
jgi:hypothetical protein